MSVVQQAHRSTYLTRPSVRAYVLPPTHSVTGLTARLASRTFLLCKVLAKLCVDLNRDHIELADDTMILTAYYGNIEIEILHLFLWNG